MIEPVFTSFSSSPLTRARCAECDRPLFRPMPLIENEDGAVMRWRLRNGQVKTGRIPDDVLPIARAIGLPSSAWFLAHCAGKTVEIPQDGETADVLGFGLGTYDLGRLRETIGSRIKVGSHPQFVARVFWMQGKEVAQIAFMFGMKPAVIRQFLNSDPRPKPSARPADIASTTPVSPLKAVP